MGLNNIDQNDYEENKDEDDFGDQSLMMDVNSSIILCEIKLSDPNILDYKNLFITYTPYTVCYYCMFIYI